jgi:hypothetical protein
MQTLAEIIGELHDNLSPTMSTRELFENIEEANSRIEDFLNW